MPRLHSPVIRTEVASTLVAEGPSASLEQFRDRLRDLGRCEGVIWVDDSITVTDIRPGQWHGILSLLRDTDLVIRRLADEGKIVSEVGDRLCSWEYALASEAAAKKRVCPCCRGNSFMPVSREDAGVRSVYTYCLVCKRAVAPIVDRARYD